MPAKYQNTRKEINNWKEQTNGFGVKCKIDRLGLCGHADACPGQSKCERLKDYNKNTKESNSKFKTGLHGTYTNVPCDSDDSKKTKTDRKKLYRGKYQGL